MRTPRGMTMVEVLVSLALLGALTALAASWIEIAGATGPRRAETLRRERAVVATLQLIHDDLANGDLAERRTARRWLEAEPSRLLVVTRSPGLGSVTHEYRLDRSAPRLTRETRSDGRTRRRPLLIGVEAFECTMDDETRVLTVAITVDGETATRRYALP